MAHFVLQIAIILIIAKLAAELAEKFHMPTVLGELMAGMIIGPYALGGVNLPIIGKLFPIPETTGHHGLNIPVSNELYSLSEIGAVILLFLAGLETNLKQFLAYGFRATVVAMGGVILPFLFGSWATVYFGHAPSFMDIHALFVGAILTATSVGITARVLNEKGHLGSPEGVTILGAAVIDDVLGILVLAIVLSMGAGEGGAPASIGEIAAKAIGFWLGLSFIGFILSKGISKFLSSLKTEGAAIALGIALCFLASALAEIFGLAMIIGAFMIGLVISHTEIAKLLRDKISSVYHFLVPIFFVVMGMLVNFTAMKTTIIFGLVVSILAIIGKIGGCGLPALVLGFNKLGAFRIGVGMMPRGEVALIVAGIGLSRGIIHENIYGVSIMMTFITTFIAPIVLVQAFKSGKSGRRLE